jgi:hypothetical protein
MLSLALVVAAASTRVLVLDLEAVGVDKDVARSIDPFVANAAAVPGVEVVAQSELKKVADVEAQKAELGCDSSSCLSELAGAMGAQLVLFGSVSKLGSTTTVAIAIFDSSNTGILRDSISVDDVGQLPKALPDKVRSLVERAHAHAARAPPASTTSAPPEGVEMPSPLYYAGMAGVILGGTGLVAGGVLAAFNEATIDDPSALAGTKKNAQQTGLIGLGVAAAGVVVAGAGGIALAVGE